MNNIQCPKCGYFSGDDWSQCNQDCPMPMSPHYKRKEEEEKDLIKCDEKGNVNIYKETGILTVNELKVYLDKLIEMGHGESKLYFDTDAQEFNYHFAAVGSAFFEPVMNDIFGHKAVSFSEARNKNNG